MIIRYLIKSVFQSHGVNSIAVGKDDNETLWLYSCSAFGELKQWWPAAVELIYQNTAWHPGAESKVFIVELEVQSIQRSLQVSHVGLKTFLPLGEMDLEQTLKLVLHPHTLQSESNLVCIIFFWIIRQ